MALILTAVKHGAVVANYTELTDLTKGENGKINGADVVDVFTGEKVFVKAKVRAADRESCPEHLTHQFV